jgi:RimJ/RimL family protein N-acetyltransferase
MLEIEQIGEDDWRVLREIRLRALTADPSVFASSAAAEASFSEESWRSRLRGPDIGIFIVLVNREPAGMTGVVIDRDDSSKRTALFWGSWLRPDLRGLGLATRLYEARIAWVRRHSTCIRVVVSHRESNAASKHANQKHGFRWIRAEKRIWNDGLAEMEHFYELTLDDEAR